MFYRSNLLKSDYFRIEIDIISTSKLTAEQLKSDYFRIEIFQYNIMERSPWNAKIRLF